MLRHIPAGYPASAHRPTPEASAHTSARAALIPAATRDIWTMPLAVAKPLTRLDNSRVWATPTLPRSASILPRSPDSLDRGQI